MKIAFFHSSIHPTFHPSVELKGSQLSWRLNLVGDEVAYPGTAYLSLKQTGSRSLKAIEGWVEGEDPLEECSGSQLWAGVRWG